MVQASAQATATTTPRATPTTLMAEPEPEPQPQPLRSRSKSRLRKCFLSQPHNSSVLASIIKHDNTRAEVACFTLACRVCTYTTASGAGVIDAQMSGCGCGSEFYKQSLFGMQQQNQCSGLQVGRARSSGAMELGGY